MSEVYEQLIALRVLKDLVADADRKTRAKITLGKGSRETVWVIVEDEEVELGQVLRTKPKPEARVCDQVALDEWLTATQPNAVETTLEFTDVHQVAAVVAEAGRDDLIREQVRVPDWLREDAKRRALAGEPVPGVQVVVGEGTLTVRPSPVAPSAVEALIRSRAIRLDEVLAIEAGEA